MEYFSSPGQPQGKDKLIWTRCARAFHGIVHKVINRLKVDKVEKC